MKLATLKPGRRTKNKNRKNRKRSSSTRMTSLGKFEAMEDRKLFAADLMGAAELAENASVAGDHESWIPVEGLYDSAGEGEAAAEDHKEWIIIESMSSPVFGPTTTSPAGNGELKPNPDDSDDDDGPTPIDPVIGVELQHSQYLLDRFKPSPDDDDPPGPHGPVFKNFEHILLDNVLAQQFEEEEIIQMQLQQEGGNGETEGKPAPDPECEHPLVGACDITANPEMLPSRDPLDTEGKPSPDDDDPPGPIGPVYHLFDAALVEILEEAMLPTLDLVSGFGETEGKPDPDPECEHRYAAACDIKANETEEEAPEPEVDPECSHPYTASCDYADHQNEDEDHTAPQPARPIRILQMVQHAARRMRVRG